MSSSKPKKDADEETSANRGPLEPIFPTGCLVLSWFLLAFATFSKLVVLSPSRWIQSFIHHIRRTVVYNKRQSRNKRRFQTSWSCRARQIWFLFNFTWFLLRYYLLLSNLSYLDKANISISCLLLTTMFPGMSLKKNPLLFSHLTQSLHPRKQRRSNIIV